MSNRFKERGKKIAYPIIDAFYLMKGFIEFLVSGKTPARTYQSMIRMFCMSGGWSSDLLSMLVGFFRKPYSFPSSEGVLGDLSPGRVKEIASLLRRDGYFVFEKRLSEELCDALTKFARETECRVEPTDEQIESRKPITAIMTRYTPDNPIGIRYQVPTQAMLDNPVVQKFLRDMSILSVAQSYLGSSPILDIVTMWWNTAFTGKPGRLAAQYYHFDMDRIRWLKFFFYLTDVTDQSGPHCFVARSHRRKGIPLPLLQKGYSRLTDEEVVGNFPDPELFKVFTGPRGTIIAEDTRGLHKGKNVERGDRLIFQLEFTNSLFGGQVEDCRLGEIHDPKLIEVMRSFPRIFSAFSD